MKRSKILPSLALGLVGLLPASAEDAAEESALTSLAMGAYEFNSRHSIDSIHENSQIKELIYSTHENSFEPRNPEYNFFFQFNEEVKKDIEKMDPKYFSALMYINSTGDPIWQFQEHPNENHPDYERFEDYVTKIGGDVLEDMAGKVLEEIWESIKDKFGDGNAKEEKDSYTVLGGELTVDYDVADVEEVNVKDDKVNISGDLIGVEANYKNPKIKFAARLRISDSGITGSMTRVLTPIEKIYDENGNPTGDFYTLGFPVALQGKVEYEDFNELKWKFGLSSSSQFRKNDKAEAAKERGWRYFNPDFSGTLSYKGTESDPLGADLNFVINW